MVAFCLAPPRAVSGSADWTLRVWDACTDQVVGMLGGHDSLITSLWLDADGKQAVTSWRDGALRVWDVETGTVLSEELEHSHVRSTVAFDSQGNIAVLGSLLGTLRVWDLTRGRTLHLLQEGADGILDVVLPSDGRTAITADKSDTLRVWDLQSGVQRMTIAGTAGRVDAVSIAPNGEVAYSVYGDTVVATHIQRGVVLGSLSVDHQITAMAVVPDGRRLALGDESGRVHLLRLDG